MTGVSLQLDVEGLAEVREFLSRVQNFDRTRLLETLASTVENQVRRRIAQERRGPDGRWAPRSTRYAQSRQGSGGSLLQRSGALRDSITSSVSDGEARIGTRLAYGATHQFGDQRTVQVGPHQRTITQVFGRPLKDGPKTVSVAGHSLRRNIPARPFLWFSPENIEDLRDQTLDFLERTALRK